MQEEIENKTVTLVVNGSKFTGRMFKAAILGFLRYTKNKAQQHKNVKPQGKQSLKKLVGQNAGVTNWELGDDADVKAFDRVARKYGVDYAIKRADGDPPRFLLFFKGRDQDAIQAAFDEYAAKKLNREDRPSITKSLIEIAKTIAHLGRDRAKDREISR